MPSPFQSPARWSTHNACVRDRLRIDLTRDSRYHCPRVPFGLHCPLTFSEWLWVLAMRRITIALFRSLYRRFVNAPVLPSSSTVFAVMLAPAAYACTMKSRTSCVGTPIEVSPRTA